MHHAGELYQYILSAVYHQDGLWGEATFDLYLRSLSPRWSYAVVAGLEPVLEYLEGFSVSGELIEQLKVNPVFSNIKPSFFEHLRRMHFEGEVWAIPEGELVFPNQPILRITAPLTLCTLLETSLIGHLSNSLFVATRAARITQAAGRPVLDFGSRRWPEPRSAEMAARAAYIGGFAATTNASAALKYNIPPIGTMPDTFLAAYGNDKLAIDAFRHRFPGLCHLALTDDDPIQGLLAYQGIKKQVQSIRIDHAELHRVATEVRAALDQYGMKTTRIIGSGSLDEYKIASLVAARAPVDWFAIGRALATANQEGSLAWRIAELYRGTEPVPVTRQGAAPHPGKKQILRYSDHDCLILDYERHDPGARSLLELVMQEGRRTRPAPP